MNYGNIQLRMTLKINVGCLLLRSEMNYGNIRLCMTLKSADKFTGFFPPGFETSPLNPDPAGTPIKSGKTPEPGGFRTGFPGPGYTLT